MMTFAALALTALTVTPALPMLRAMHGIAAGAIVSGEDVVAIACERPIAHMLRYDAQARAVRAVRPIAPGQCLLGGKLDEGAIIEPGQRARVVTRVGSVQVERTVETLQAARPGGRLFVRGAEGAPFSIGYEALAR